MNNFKDIKELGFADLDTEEVHNVLEEFRKEQEEDKLQKDDIAFADLNTQEVHEIVNEFNREVEQERKHKRR